MKKIFLKFITIYYDSIVLRKPKKNEKLKNK